MAAQPLRKIGNADALSGIQRAAVLIMYLERDVARKLLTHLPTSQLSHISEAMVEVAHITPDVIESVVSEFVQDLYNVSLVPKTGPDYALGVLPNLLDDERRTKVIGPLKRKLSKDFEEYIGTRPARTVAAILQDEHPQTRSLACLLMGPDNANAVLQFLPDDQRYDVAMRMANIERIPSELADDVESALMAALDDRGSDLWSIEGVDKAAAVLSRMELEDQESLLGQIADEDQSLSETLRKRMVTFDDLKVLDDRSVQQLLKNTDRETLLISLRGADPILREAFFGNMSKRAAADLRDEIEIGKPVPKQVVTEAQEEMVNTALRLKEEGLLMLPIGGAGEDMV